MLLEQPYQSVTNPPYRLATLAFTTINALINWIIVTWNCVTIRRYNSPGLFVAGLKFVRSKLAHKVLCCSNHNFFVQVIFFKFIWLNSWFFYVNIDWPIHCLVVLRITWPNSSWIFHNFLNVLLSAWTDCNYMNVSIIRMKLNIFELKWFFNEI